MLAKQLTVFIENRTGRLCEVLNVLKQNNVNILSLSLADTTEYGLLRLIVDQPALGKEKLSENGFSSLLSEVSIIKIPHKAGSLQELLKAIEEGGVNIEYMYGLSIEGEEAYVVLKASDAEKIETIFSAYEITTVTDEHLRGLN
ncbi:MAG: amino acid-binding protein [Clostridia bacterium]|nr:amino acid-binding protein [Clostridia bacterium]